MNFFKKAFSLILVLVLCTALFAGCGNAAASSSSSGADSSTVEAVEPGIFVDGKKVELDPVATVAGHDVSFDMYRYFYLYYKAQMDGGDATVWENEETVAQLTSTVEETLKSFYAVKIMAEENNIALTDEDKAEIETSLASNIENFGSEEAYQAALVSANCTPEVYEELMANTMLQQRVFEALYSDDFSAVFEDEYVRASHILVSFGTPEYEKTETPENATDEQKAAIDAENEEKYNTAMAALKAEKLKTAEAVLAKAQKGDDFEALITEYNEDPGMALNEENHYDGYCFTTGEMVKEFEEAAFALKDNEISGIVETSYGYHIIKRLPMDEAFKTANFEASLYTSRFVDEFYSHAEDVMATLKVEPAKGFDKITPTTLQ
ncbi:MAG: peptidylprolyl isomerase [Oscillospiraceae bacterium]|nr:peptidylprolyl isomerase [Oscillospiraceae bacterium]